MYIYKDRGNNLKTNIYNLNKIYKARLEENSEFILNEIWDEDYYGRNYKISKNDTVVDLGGNQGIFAIYAASKGASVYSYEPVNEMFELLEENVSSNKLSESIKPYNYAVSSIEEDIEISIPQTSGDIAPGMGSINKLNVSNFENMGSVQLKTQVVKTITLSEIIKDLDVVNLLKVDCEGAELDILQSANYEDIQKVQNIVMETHSGYSQKSLCLKLKEFGFSIQEFDKISNKYRAGYLFATRNTTEEYQSVYSLITSKNYYPVGSSFEMSADESFAIQDVNSSLICNWKLDDELKASNDNSKLEKFSFDEPGTYKIGLDVEDRHGNVDFADKWITILKNDYNEFTPDYILKTSELKFPVSKSKDAKIQIPSNVLPKLFDFSNVKLSISCIDDELDAVLEFNSKEFNLFGYYDMATLQNMPDDLDLNFTIKSNVDSELILQWWVGSEDTSENEDTENVDYSKEKFNGIQVLPPANKETILENLAYSEFVIKKENFPTSWTPQNIVFMVSIMDSIDQTLVSSKLAINDNEFTMDGWYYSAKVNFDSLNDDVSVKLVLPFERDIKIGWWTE